MLANSAPQAPSGGAARLTLPSRSTFSPWGGIRRRFHYGWIVVGVTFLTLLLSAGARSAPGVYIHRLEADFGWSRADISFGVSIGLLMFGLTSIWVGRLIDWAGPRRLMVGGLALISLSFVVSTVMTDLWQLDLLWGAFSGIGTGLTAAVLGAVIANRWFVTRRGLVVGLFGAASSAGQLIFVPSLIQLAGTVGWRGGVLVLAGAAALTLIVVFVLMRNDPANVALRPYGAADSGPVPAAGPLVGALGRALRTPEFWLLSGTFFVCGATSNGLIGTHFLPHSVDHGIPELTAAGILALMGGMNFVGSIASGWLTDRVDPRRLLAVYYTLRGLSLFLLPFLGDTTGLAFFAILFGLDYIATVPPTVTLAADLFGRRNVGVIFGWIFFAHQIGAALASYLGGVARLALGDYQLTFIVAALIAIAGGLLALRIDRSAGPDGASALASSSA